MGGKKVDISLRLVKMALVPNSLGPGHVDSSVKRVVVSTKTLFPKYIYIVRYLKGRASRPGVKLRVTEDPTVDNGPRIPIA